MYLLNEALRLNGERCRRNIFFSSPLYECVVVIAFILHECSTRIVLVKFAFDKTNARTLLLWFSFHFSYFLFYKSQLKSEIPTFASSSSRSCITNNKLFAYYRRYCDDTEEIDIAFSFVPSCSVCDTFTAKKSTLTSTYKVSSFITIKTQLISINLFLHTDGTLNTYLSICSPSVHPAFRLFVVYRRRRFIVVIFVVVRPYTCRKSGESLHVIPFFSFSIFCFAFILYIFLFIFYLRFFFAQFRHVLLL